MVLQNSNKWSQKNTTWRSKIGVNKKEKNLMIIQRITLKEKYSIEIEWPH